jgi:hypothetical protein
LEVGTAFKYRKTKRIISHDIVDYNLQTVLLYSGQQIRKQPFLVKQVNLRLKDKI